MATLDLPAVRRFTDDLNQRVRQCDNGEGMFCSNLDESISYYVQLCGELRDYIDAWARAVFTGQIALDPEVESHLKEEARGLIKRAGEVAARARPMEPECFELQRLHVLHWRILDFDYLVNHWVSPRPAVSPSPRVNLPDEAGEQIRERITGLPALPSDWRPGDPDQLAFFQNQQAK